MKLRGNSWFFASWADASDRPRPDGSRTGGYVITLATEKLHVPKTSLRLLLQRRGCPVWMQQMVDEMQV